MGMPPAVASRYRIEQLLGSGGSGEVYRARDLTRDQPVALKIVRPERLGGPPGQRRFLRDAQIVSTLRHPSIASILDYGASPDGGAYLVMELVAGDDLRRVLQREGRLDPHRALRILSAVCAAVEAAHREGVLHRDLKPENILLPGGDVEAKVLDFGAGSLETVEQGQDRLVADASSIVAAAGTIIGTPAYMAPEQFRGVPPDSRTDVFSLGVIAYEMVSGELPFGRGTVAEIMLAQARGVRPMPGAPIPAAAERAIRGTLDRDPDRRSSTPQAFAHLLAASLGLSP